MISSGTQYFGSLSLSISPHSLLTLGESFFETIEAVLSIWGKAIACSWQIIEQEVHCHLPVLLGQRLPLLSQEPPPRL